MCLGSLRSLPHPYIGNSGDLFSTMVGVGYHHPSVQWPNTPMDERQRGNLAAVACQGGLSLLGFRAPLSPTPWSFSPWLSRQRGTLHAEFVPCRRVGTAVAMAFRHLYGVLTPYVLPRTGEISLSGGTSRKIGAR